MKRKKENSSTLFRTVLFQLKKLFFILVILQLLVGNKNVVFKILGTWGFILRVFNY